MSAKPLMLEGFAENPKAADEQLHRLRKDKQQLEEEVLGLRRELDDVNRDKDRLERSLRELRQQLSPLHRALRAVFGEIELAVGEEDKIPSSGTPGVASATDPRWQSYKNQFPGVPAATIDALLTHHQMTLTQLASFLKKHYDTTKGAVAKLIKAGAVVREGGLVRLNR